MPINKRITSKAIRAFREENKLSKAEMARRLSLSASHYLNLEAGRNSPSYEIVISFLEMGLDLTKIMGHKNSKIRKKSI